MVSEDGSKGELCFESFQDLSAHKDRGILKRIIREGLVDLKPCNNDTVLVHYVGTYYGGKQDGKKFDSSRDRNECFKFTIGKGDVIQAWDVGVASMKIGETCEIIAASEYAYKDDKSMKFEIELIDIQGLDISLKGDGSVRMSVIDKETERSQTHVGLKAHISYYSMSDPDAITDVSYVVGDPASNGVPETVDLAIPKMKTGQRCRVRSHHKSTAMPDTLDTSNIYFVTLKNPEEVPCFNQMDTFDEAIAYVDKLKARANEYLKDGKYSVAKSIYSLLEYEVDYIRRDGVLQEKQCVDRIKAVRLNLAFLYLKIKDFDHCFEVCKRVLQEHPSEEKALFRTGQAYLLRRDHENAAVYFEKVLEMNPKNTLALKQLCLCKEVIQRVQDLNKLKFKGIFDRLKKVGLGAEIDPRSKIKADNEKYIS